MENVYKAKSKNRKTILILLILNVIIILAFLFWGITSKNIDFFLPKRIIKVVAIVVVSFSIGFSSVTFQTITNNRILTPSVMGLDSLYLFIQTLIVFFFGSGKIEFMSGYLNFFLSITIMLGASFLLFILLFKGKGKNVYFLVLAGMVMGNLFNGFATFMQVLLDPNEFSVLQGKMFASFSNINSELLGVSVITLIIIFIISRKDLPYLDVLNLGVDQAINLGVSYNSLVLKTLMITAVLISISTVLVGPITFLGILIVSLARQVLKSYKHKHLTIGAGLIGNLFLVLGLFLTERVFHFTTTLSVIINFIGGIYFIFLMLKESRA